MLYNGKLESNFVDVNLKFTETKHDTSLNLDSLHFWDVLEYVEEFLEYGSDFASIGNDEPILFKRILGVLGDLQERLFSNVPVHAIYYNVVMNATKKIVFIGELHSCIVSFSVILKNCRSSDMFEKGMRLKQNCHIVFVGNLFGKGLYDIDILMLVFWLMLENLGQVHICAGQCDFAVDKPVDGETMVNSFFNFN